MTVRGPRPSCQGWELIVLALVALGLLLILLGIIAGLFGWFESKVNQPLPNWAENVLVSIATATVLKLGDVLATLVALSGGRTVESLSHQLASSTPAAAIDPPADATEAADQVADAARDEAAAIAGGTPKD
jgi:hypothetical protein